MSDRGSHIVEGHAPSDMMDAIVLSVLASVCLAGALLTAPRDSASSPLTAPATQADNASSNPVIIGPPAEPTPPDAADNQAAPAIAIPSAPALKPSLRVEPPSLKPAPPETTMTGVVLTPLPELSASELDASATGFISLMGTNYDPTNWHRSTHKANSDFLATDWSTDHATYDADGLTLKLERAPQKTDHFISGEIQTRETYGYGRYEVLMRPAKGNGSVSSFFTYTGPYYGKPHDEVDIEFLGQNTREIYLNYFHNGQVGEAQTVPLPFDASEALHLYAFEWRPDAITWYVDGKPLHRTRPADALIPQTPGSIIVNLWSGKRKLYAWHGRPDFDGAIEAEYACISFQPFGSTGRSCSTIFPPEDAPASPSRPSLIARSAINFFQQILSEDKAPAQLN